MRRFFQFCCSCLGLLLLLGSATNNGALGQASAYTSIVVFGDSLSDVGNDAAVSGAIYPPAAQVPTPLTGYTYGRFTDGTDTLPPAHLYTGVWIEQLAALLPSHPTITNSLAGGTDYAYGFATTASGTSTLTYGPSNAFSVPVNNLGLQVSDYLATNPTINNSVLYVVWGGANDLINATSSADILAAATRDVGLVQTLIGAGAKNIIVPVLPPLGLVPRFNGSAATAAQVNAAAGAYNQALTAGIAQLTAATAGMGVNLHLLDTATLFNTIVSAPSAYGFTNVTASSQATLTSPQNAALNPDTYLFWDDLHPTTAGHHLLALNALRLLSTPVVTSTALMASATTINQNTSVTFTATVTNATGGTDTPLGTVTFLDGSTPIGTGFLSGSGSFATATLTTSTLAAGTQTITAAYATTNGFAASSSVLTETVVPPTYSASLSPSSLTINRGDTGAAIVTITPAGGYTGSFTIACGTLPVHFSCTVQNPSLTISGTSTVSTAIVFNTMASANTTPTFFRNDNPIVLAFLGFPMLGGLAFAARRRTAASLRLTLFLAIASVSLLGLTACGDSKKNDTPSGTYQVPITVTPATGVATTLNLSVTVQ